MTAARSRTRERLEASLTGLCELELRKQRQECLVLGALALADPLPGDPSDGELSCFSSWGQENLTLRRQLSALQSSPWGLMQALEQQVGELRIDADDGCYDGAQPDACDSSGFYESSERQSPKGRSCCTEATEAFFSRVYTGDRPKSIGDPLNHNEEMEMPVRHNTLPRSFSAPYPPLEGIAEEGPAVDSWQWDIGEADQHWRQQQPTKEQVVEEDYQQAMRAECYIINLLQRHTLAQRPCQPRTRLSPDLTQGSGIGNNSQQKTILSLNTEQRLPDPHLHPQVDLSTNPVSQDWGCDLLEGEACGGEAPSLEEDCYLSLPYPQCRPHSLAGRLPSPLPSLDPNCDFGGLNLCCEPTAPQHYLHSQPPANHKLNLASGDYIPGQSCHAPVHSPRHYKPEEPKTHRGACTPNHPNPKSRSSKKSHNDRQRFKKSSSKASRSQSENSLLAQRVLLERSINDQHQENRDLAPNQGQAARLLTGNSTNTGSRRWCSNFELSQDEGETQVEQTNRRPPRKARHGHPCPYVQPSTHHPHQTLRWYSNPQEKAPICQGEGSYAGAAPAESESSMSEVYSPASSSLSSDSDESGGLVWPQQLPPRLAASSSSSSPSPQASANPCSPPKAFVKIKASHALKKKILRFRSGSLKVMTTV